MFYNKLFLCSCKNIVSVSSRRVRVCWHREWTCGFTTKESFHILFLSSCFLIRPLSFSLFLMHTCFSSAGFYNAWFPEVLQPLSAYPCSCSHGCWFYISSHHRWMTLLLSWELWPPRLPHNSNPDYSCSSSGIWLNKLMGCTFCKYREP